MRDPGIGSSLKIDAVKEEGAFFLFLFPSGCVFQQPVGLGIGD
jgi:hypothetical protein